MLVGTFSLVPQAADAVSVPVIAAGGIADGRGAAAALTLGAAGLQIGTAVLATDESGAGAVPKSVLRSSAGGQSTAPPDDLQTPHSEPARAPDGR